MPKIDYERLASFDKTALMSLERTLEENIRREMEARRQAIEEKKAKKRRRKKKKRPSAS
jgi:hypothetical protein